MLSLELWGLPLFFSNGPAYQRRAGRAQAVTPARAPGSSCTALSRAQLKIFNRANLKSLIKLFAAALLPRLFGTNPRSHHKCSTARVRTADQRLPVLCHCKLGPDIPNIRVGSRHWHPVSCPPGPSQRGLRTGEASYPFRHAAAARLSLAAASAASPLPRCYCHGEPSRHSDPPA